MDPSRTATTTAASSPPTPAAPSLTACRQRPNVSACSVHQRAPHRLVSSNSSLFLPPAAKKSSDAAPAAAKKPPAAKAKKPDKSIWDSDSDSASKNPAPALKGTEWSRRLSGPLGGALQSPALCCVQVKDGGGRGRTPALRKTTVQSRK